MQISQSETENFGSSDIINIFVHASEGHCLRGLRDNHK